MDLSERSSEPLERHPWEVARALAVAELVSRLGLTRPRTLDVGCGDAYLVRELLRAGIIGEAVGQDIHLESELMRAWSGPSLDLVRELSELGGRRFELVLLLDVLEHIEDPAVFLSKVVENHLDPGAKVLITVPAFQALFSRHDRDLLHYRRYARGEIEGVATAAGLRVTDSGYLFSSLLVPRALAALAEKVVAFGTTGNVGVGHWRAPAQLTRLLTIALKLDNRLSFAAHDRGVTLPGLSCWLSCNRPS